MPLFHLEPNKHHTIDLAWKLISIPREDAEDQEALIMRFNKHIWAFPMYMLMQFFLHEYEILERSVVNQFYNATDVVVEAGGGSGVVGLTMLKNGVKLITYEPRLESCQLMRDMFELNDCPDVKIICAAIASKTGYVTLVTDKIWWDATIIDQKHLEHPISELQVPCFNVNDVLKEHGANALHIDVEGGEINILEALNFSLVNKVSLEVHPSMIGENSYDDIIKPLLVKAGFIMTVEAGMERNFPTHNYCVGFERKI